MTEDVFVKVLNNLDSYDPARGGKLSTWIYAIARNTVADYRKKAYVNRENAIDESVEMMSRHDKYYFDDPDSLKYVVAKMLNITPKAVSDRYARLLNKCRKIHEKF